MQKQLYNLKSMYSPTKNRGLVFVSLVLCFVMLFANVFAYNSLYIPADTKTYWKDYQIAVQPVKDDMRTRIYEVSTPQQLAYIFFTVLAKSKLPITPSKEIIINPNNKTTINVSLKNDIDLSEHYWSSTSVINNLNFEGNNHIIFGFKSESEKNGLIESSSSKIVFQNTNINCNIQVVYSATSNYGTGAFIGQYKGTSLSFENCKAYGKISCQGTNKTASIGGFVGIAKSFIATNCSNSVDLDSLVASDVGGFVGKTTNSCKFTLCSNFGKIGSSIDYAGGLVGYCCGLNLNTAKSCNYAYVSSVSAGSFVGGLVGYAESVDDSTVSYVYNNGDMIIGDCAGGLIGDSEVSLKFENVYNSCSDIIANKNTSTNGGTIGTFKEGTGSDLGIIWGNGQEIIVQNVGDKNYKFVIEEDCAYWINFKYQLFYRDISLIGNDTKIISKSNTYSVEPSGTSIGGKLLDFLNEYNNIKFAVDGRVVNSYYLRLNTGYFKDNDNKQVFEFGYYDKYFLDDSQYCGNIGGNNNNNGKCYYIDGFWGQELEIPSDKDYYFDGHLNGAKIWHHLLLSNAMYMYTVLQSDNYKTNGLPKKLNGAVNYDIIANLIRDTFWDKNPPTVKLVGARGLMFYNNNRCDLLVYPLMKISFSDIGDYLLPYFIFGKAGIYYHIDDGCIRIYSIINNPDVDLDDYINKRSSFYSINGIKSANFDGDIYGKSDDINNGFPVFKEMYWEFCE